MVAQTRITAEEFDRIASLPEIVELVSNNYSSLIAAIIGGEVSVYVNRNDLGYVTGADGGYIVAGERYILDVAFISKARQPEPSHEVYNSKAPDLAIEVISPTDVLKDVLEKVANYLMAGTVVWVAFPDEKQIKVFEPGVRVESLGLEDTLDGEKVLPGFKLPLKYIFKA